MKGILATLKGKIILASLAVLLVVAGIVITVVVTASPDDYRTIKIQELNGQTLISGENLNEQEAYKGMNLKSGDIVTVQESSNMTLLLDMDKYMFADAGTKFRVEASGNSEKGDTKTRIVLEEGSVLCKLDSKLGDDESFEVETPNSVMSVRGTIFKMTIYKGNDGENYARVDVLEGAVKVDLQNENGEKTGEEGMVEAGQAATVHSNTETSEFVIGDSDISYEDFSEEMATFVVEFVDNGREICIGSDLFKHYTGLENHPETETVVKEATCKEEGTKDIYCSVCKMVVRTESIEKTDHTKGEWTIEEDAPCVERMRCTVCDEILEEREADFSKHDLERKTVETANGCNVHIVVSDVCKNCNMTKEVSARDEVRHTYGDWQTVKNVSCTEDGERQMVCSKCNDTISESIPATGHSYGSYTTVTAATCTAEGIQERTCGNCGNKETASLAVTGHNYQKVSETPATCTTAGETVTKCAGCGDTVKETIAATGHSVTYIHEGFSGEYTTNAYTIEYIGTCSICGEEISREIHTGTWSRSDDPYYVTGTCECGHSGLYSM